MWPWFLHVTADHAPADGFVAALDAPLAPLRIAVSFDAPPPSVKLGTEQRAAVAHTADLLRSLGHHVFEREVDYGLFAAWKLSVRYFNGVHHDAATMARRETR